MFFLLFLWCSLKHEGFKFWWSPIYLCFILLLMLLVSYLKIHYLTQGHENSYLCFPCKSFIVLATTCRSWEVGVQIHPFACRYLVVPELFVESLFFAPFNSVSTFWETSWPEMWGFVSGLLNSIAPYVYPRVSDKLSCLLSLLVSFEMRKCEFSNFVLVFLGPLNIHMNIRISLSVSVKKPATIFGELILNL